jgi:hypothetical protein
VRYSWDEILRVRGKQWLGTTRNRDTWAWYWQSSRDCSDMGDLQSWKQNKTTKNRWAEKLMKFYLWRGIVILTNLLIPVNCLHRCELDCKSHQKWLTGSQSIACWVLSFPFSNPATAVSVCWVTICGYVSCISSMCEKTDLTWSSLIWLLAIAMGWSWGMSSEEVLVELFDTAKVRVVD